MSDYQSKLGQDTFESNLDREIDLRELATVLWTGRWIISGLTSLTAALSVVFALSLPNIYSADALLAPAESNSGGLSSLMMQYGGLANLAGVALPAMQEGSKSQLGIHLMQSRAFIGDFVDRRDILPELFAVKSWSDKTGEIEFDQAIYDTKSGTWLREGTDEAQPKPTRLEAHQAFAALLDISEDIKTGYVTVSIEHQSPILAAQWVTWLVNDVNAAVKAQDVAEARKSIEYLRQQVANTSLTELHAVFFELIQAQMETVMLAEVRPEYVFKVIDPAVIPEVKSAPSRALIVIVGMIIGGMLSVLFVLLRHYLRGDYKSSV